MRATLCLLAMAGLTTAGCSMLPCRHPHDAVCDEIEDRSLTSLIAYCPCLDLNGIGRQPWFRPSSCLATDSRQRRIVRRPPPPMPHIDEPKPIPEPAKQPEKKPAKKTEENERAAPGG